MIGSNLFFFLFHQVVDILLNQIQKPYHSVEIRAKVSSTNYDIILSRYAQISSSFCIDKLNIQRSNF